LTCNVWVIPTVSIFSFICTKTHGQNPIHIYLCYNVYYELIPEPSITVFMTYPVSSMMQPPQDSVQSHSSQRRPKYNRKGKQL